MKMNKLIFFFFATTLFWPRSSQAFLGELFSSIFMPGVSSVVDWATTQAMLAATQSFSGGGLGSFLSTQHPLVSMFMPETFKQFLGGDDATGIMPLILMVLIAGAAVPAIKSLNERYSDSGGLLGGVSQMFGTAGPTLFNLGQAAAASPGVTSLPSTWSVPNVLQSFASMVKPYFARTITKDALYKAHNKYVVNFGKMLALIYEKLAKDQKLLKADSLRRSCFKEFSIYDALHSQVGKSSPELIYLMSSTFRASSLEFVDNFIKEAKIQTDYKMVSFWNFLLRRGPSINNQLLKMLPVYKDSVDKLTALEYSYFGDKDFLSTLNNSGLKSFFERSVFTQVSLTSSQFQRHQFDEGLTPILQKLYPSLQALDPQLDLNSLLLGIDAFIDEYDTGYKENEKSAQDAVSKPKQTVMTKVKGALAGVWDRIKEEFEEDDD